MSKYKNLDKEKFISVCNKSHSMSSAAAELKMHFSTFKKYAMKFNVYRTNQAGKGINKKSPSGFKLKNILKGQHPQYGTYHLKVRLLRAGVFKNKCVKCGIEEWQGKKLNMELDHIDGDRTNHLFQNLRILCPNCHAQTDTYRFKKRKKSNKKDTEISIPEEVEEKIRESHKNTPQRPNKNIEKGPHTDKKNLKKCLNHSCSNNHSNKHYCSKRCYNAHGLSEDRVLSKTRSRKVQRPPYKQLREDIENSSYKAVGRKYGVSDNSVRKWLAFYEKIENLTDAKNG